MTALFVIINHHGLDKWDGHGRTWTISVNKAVFRIETIDLAILDATRSYKFLDSLNFLNPIVRAYSNKGNVR